MMVNDYLWTSSKYLTLEPGLRIIFIANGSILMKRVMNGYVSIFLPTVTKASISGGYMPISMMNMKILTMKMVNGRPSLVAVDFIIQIPTLNAKGCIVTVFWDYQQKVCMPHFP